MIRRDYHTFAFPNGKHHPLYGERRDDHSRALDGLLDPGLDTRECHLPVLCVPAMRPTFEFPNEISLGSDKLFEINHSIIP